MIVSKTVTEMDVKHTASCLKRPPSWSIWTQSLVGRMNLQTAKFKQYGKRNRYIHLSSIVVMSVKLPENYKVLSFRTGPRQFLQRAGGGQHID